MTYEQQIRTIVTFLYNTTKCFATSSTYHISYDRIKQSYGMWVGTKTIQDDIREEFCNNHLDKIQALDFDDIKQEVVVMIWESNTKAMKKYTLENYKEFCDKALICPPFEDEENWQKWIDSHKVQIIANDCVMELDYDADTINEIEFSLREIYEAILGDGTATTGNTFGSQYRPAELKDVVRYFIMCRYENWGGLNWFDYAKQAVVEMSDIQSVIGVYEHARQIAKYINFKCNWHNFKTESLKDATEEGIKKIILDLVGSELEISYDSSTDKSFLIDYTFKESGDFIDWTWGQMDENVQCELITNYKTQIFE